VVEIASLRGKAERGQGRVSRVNASVFALSAGSWAGLKSGKGLWAHLPETIACGFITVEGKQTSDARQQTFPTDNHSRPSPVVPAKTTWLPFMAAYQLWVLEDADRCSEPARLGAWSGVKGIVPHARPTVRGSACELPRWWIHGSGFWKRPTRLIRSGWCKAFPGHPSRRSPYGATRRPRLHRPTGRRKPDFPSQNIPGNLRRL